MAHADRVTDKTDCETVEQSGLDHRRKRADWKLPRPDRAEIRPAPVRAGADARPA